MVSDTHQPSRGSSGGFQPPRRVAVAHGAAWTVILLVVAMSAVVAKEFTSRRSTPALAMLDSAEMPEPVDFAGPPSIDPLSLPLVSMAEQGDETQPQSGAVEQAPAIDRSKYETDPSVRWFNGRPVRPVRTIWMTVTAYSPDSRSCGDSADDITASNHHVETNGYHLVAADSRVLPLGSMISIPGYASTKVVPVLDRGGKIKGNRLDLLFPTHEQARAWGVKKLQVVVWDYADGLPAADYRRVRDSR